MINVVCAVIFDGDGRVLACQRGAGHLAGKWEFPGGKVEEGESKELALVREIAEELECGIVVGEALPEVLHAYDGVTIRLWPYRCRLDTGVPVAVEHQAIEWVSLADSRELDWAAADLPVLDFLASDPDPLRE